MKNSTNLPVDSRHVGNEIRTFEAGRGGCLSISRIKKLFWLCVAISICYYHVTTVAWGYQLQQVESGAYVKWQQRQITYRIHHKGCQDLPLEPTITAIRDSFDTWQRAAQGKLTLLFDGESQAQGVGYDDNANAKNENLIMWEEKQWPYPKGAIAMTLVTYRMYSGQIVDADIVLNGVAYRWIIKSTSAATPTFPQLSEVPSRRQQLPAIDLANTVTHEAGHFLGLGHSDNADATMHAQQSAEEIKKRHLHLDDINAILKLYDSSDTVAQTNASWPKLPPPPSGMGCSSISMQAPSNGWSSLWFLVAFAVLLVYQRKRRNE